MQNCNVHDPCIICKHIKFKNITFIKVVQAITAIPKKKKIRKLPNFFVYDE